MDRRENWVHTLPIFEDWPALHRTCRLMDRAILGRRQNVWWVIWRADGAVARIAGLYSYWIDPDTSEVVANFTMITQLVGDHPLLSQMPRSGKEKRSLVLLEQADCDTWLNRMQVRATALIHRPSLAC